MDISNEKLGKHVFRASEVPLNAEDHKNFINDADCFRCEGIIKGSCKFHNKNE